MGVEDNYYQIPGLTHTSTFYEWMTKENTEIIPKLNLMNIYGVSAGTNIEVTIGSTGNSFDAGDAVVSLPGTISGITVSGDLIVDGNVFFSGNSADNPFVSTITRFVSSATGSTNGFEIGDVVKTSAPGFVGATVGITFAVADNVSNSSSVVGLVKEVASTHIDVVNTGLISGLTGITSGNVYYLSPTVRGAFTETKPTTVGQIVKPMIVAVSGTQAVVVNQLGIENVAGITGDTGATGDVTDPIFVSKNQVINSNYDVWQRGTQFTSSTGSRYFADRWAYFTNTSGSTSPSTTISRHGFTAGQTTVPGNPVYYAGITFTHGVSGISAGAGEFAGIEARIENPAKFSNETIHVDAFLKGSTGATLDFYIRRSQNGTTYDIEEFNAAHRISTVWQEFSSDFNVGALGKTASIDTSTGYVAVGVKINNLPTANSIDIAGFRVFSTQGNTLAGNPHRETTDPLEELDKCSRFYQRSYDLNVATGSITPISYFVPDFTAVRYTVSLSPGSTGDLLYNSEYYHDFKVPMRAIPNVTIYSPHTGITNDGYNRSANLDVRLTSGTRGFNNAQRIHQAGASTILTTPRTKGIIFHTRSGAVILDEIFVHYVADADFSI